MSKKYTITAAMALGVATLVGLTACDASSTATPAASGSTGATAAGSRPGPTDVPKACTPKGGGQLLIGMVDINEQTSFFTQMNTGAKDVADKAGAKFQLVSGDNDSATQVAGIENLISLGANAIIIDPVDATALKPAIAKAVAAGIPVISADGSIEGTSGISAQVGTANVDGGKELGDAFLKLTRGKGEVGVVAALNSAIQIQRQNGFQDAVKAGGMTIGTVVDGHNDNGTAQTAAENLVTGNPDLKYIYATGEPALNGAIAAVKSQGATDRVDVVGWDLSATSVEGLKAGYVKEVIQQDTFGFGYEAAKAAINVACGTSVPKTISVPIAIVTPDNLSQYEYYLEN